MKRYFIFLTILLILSLGYISGEHSLTLISPNGGENLTIGSAFQIRWKTNNVNTGNKVILVLYKNGIKFLTLSESTADTGLFLWKIHESIPSGNRYRIRIRSTGDLSLNDFSDGNFAISNK